MTEQKIKGIQLPGSDTIYSFESDIQLDTTVSKAGMAADAKAVKEKLDLKADVKELSLKANEIDILYHNEMQDNLTITTLYKDKEKTQEIFPKTKINAISDDSGKELKTTLNEKADRTELSLKADKTELSLKADKTELSLKADKTELSLKADKTELDELRGSGANAANKSTQEYSLGNSFTPEQSADIRSGEFKLVQVGGYWTFPYQSPDGITLQRRYYVAHADYFYDGSTENLPPDEAEGAHVIKSHHVVVVPDISQENGYVSENKNINGGYAGLPFRNISSKNHKWNIPWIATLNKIEQDFGADHILQHEELLSNAVEGDYIMGYSWFSTKAELLAASMLVGYPLETPYFGKYPVRPQLALFKNMPNKIINYNFSFLQDICDNTKIWGVDQHSFESIPVGPNNGAQRRFQPYFLVY